MPDTAAGLYTRSSIGSLPDLVAWIRSSVSADGPWPTIGLNLVLVVGVALFGWDVWTILVLYWLENAFAGVFAFRRIGLARGAPDPATTDPFSGPAVTPGALQFFLLVHYGVFWIATSQLVFGFVPGIIGRSGEAYPVSLDLLLAVVPLGLARWREYRRFVDTGEYLHATPASQMWAPYPRVVVLQGGIMAAALVSTFLPVAFGSLSVIVAKSAYEVAVELRVGVFGTLAAMINPPPRRAEVTAEATDAPSRPA